MTRQVGAWTIERRAAPVGGARRTLGFALAAVVFGLVTGALLFLPFDTSPISGYATLFQEGFLRPRGLSDALVRAAPLVFVGLGTIVTWRAGFYFLGFQGCLLLGAAGASAVALTARPGHLLATTPSPVIIVLTILAAFAAGGLWSGVVGYMKAMHGGNEVLMSLMMNFVAAYLLNYLVSGPMRADGALPQTERFPERAHLPRLAGDAYSLHAGVVVALVLAATVWVVFHLTILGFDLKAMGLNVRSSRYAGISIRSRTLTAAVLGGGFAGLAGWSQVLGVQYRLLDALDMMTGFEGIVAALLGGLAPVGLVLASFLLAGLSIGAQVMQRRAAVPASMAQIIQGVIVLTILASTPLRHYRIFRAESQTARGRSEGTPADESLA